MKTTGQLLRALRLKKSLTQAQVARLTGLTQPEVSRQEADRSQNQAAARTLRSFLVEGVDEPVNSASLSRTAIQGACRPVAERWVQEAPGVDVEVRLNQARLEFGAEWINHLVACLTERNRTILATLDLDSSWELVLVLRLLEGGWSFVKTSPLGLGCRILVRDRSQPVYIGDVARWSLCRQGDDWTLTLVPQVAVQANPTSYRMDFLGIAVRSGCRAEWRIEVDGPAHQRTSVKDVVNTLQADLPTLRLGRTDLTDPVLLRKLEAFALPLCKSRPPGHRRWR